MIVGLTGGIGSGKTFVAKLFHELGVPIYITDIEAKKLMHENTEVKEQIIELFGENVYVNNKLNTKYVASKVFENKALLDKLNGIVHPNVGKHFNEWYAKQQFDFVIKESAILFETDSYKLCDKTILVTAPKSIRIERVMSRDQITRAEVEARMANQWSDKKKIALSDFVIENNDYFYVKILVNRLFFKLKNNIR